MSGQMPGDGLELYYDAVVAEVRIALTRVSDAVQGIDLTETPSAPAAETGGSTTDLPAPVLPPGGMWIPLRPPKDFIMPAGVRPPPPRPPRGAGLQLVDVERLGQFLMIAFHWHETGDETYVYVVDLREFVDRGDGPDMAEMVITTRLYEQVGKGWLSRASVRRIGGLTFVE